MSETALALGTVQFGLPYGVAGRADAVPEDEVREMLLFAAGAGVRLLDTAPAYGSIEERLADLIGDLPFDVVSKIGPMPDGASADDAARFVEASVARSRRRLGARLTTLLFHHADDLLGPHGGEIWRAASTAAGGDCRLGASCYAPATLVALRRRHPIQVAQLPGNAFDQRLAAPGVAAAIHGVEIHLRSVYLQGLLLMPSEAAARRVPAAAGPLARWAAWCTARGVQPVSAALGIARHLPGVRVCVVGVDRLRHLEETLRAWHAAIPCSAPVLACESPAVIDPRHWGTA